MAEYDVRVPFCVWHTIRVEATSEADAEDQAFNSAGLSAFCGNGGTDKLVGVYGDNESVDVCEEPLEGDGFGIVVEEVSE